MKKAAKKVKKVKKASKSKWVKPEIYQKIKYSGKAATNIEINPTRPEAEVVVTAGVKV